MKAVNYYIVVEKIKEQQKAIEGLILTEDLDTENRFVRGKIITAGNLVEGLNSEDIVYYDKYSVLQLLDSFLQLQFYLYLDFYQI